MSSTITRMDLGDAVFREVGLSRHESSLLVETILEHISMSLIKGESVKISSFGLFQQKKSQSEEIQNWY